MKLTGAQILIRELIVLGARKIFGYPGGSVLDIYDELYKNTDKITHYITAHEQGATHAADGYARMSGEPGVIIATSGPGSTNLVTGIANAFLDSVPLIAITGNVSTSLIGKDSFQEVNIVGITMPITKHNYSLRSAKDIKRIVHEAFYIASSDRPGPVLIDIPKDIQQEVVEYDDCCEFKPPLKSYKINVASAISLLRDAKRPYIYAGGGVVISGGSNALVDFAEKLNAPVATSLMGVTAIPYDHKLALGMAGMHGRYAATKALSECDLLIAIGVRFSDRATGNKEKFLQHCKVLQIDIDRAEINKNIKVDEYIIGDVREILETLIDNMQIKAKDTWLNHIYELKNSKANLLCKSANKLTPKDIIESVQNVLGETPVATDVGQHQMWTAQYYGFTKPRAFLTSGGLGTMGYGMGAAIGACIALNNQRVVLFTSDGSFHMNLNELATCAQYNLQVVVIVLDNNALGMVRQWQTMFYGGRYSQTTLNRKTNYVDLACAFGAFGFSVHTIDELQKALQKARQTSKKPVLIHCILDQDENVFPMIPPNGTINDIIIR
ncbi:MAG: biosynthetic-type acetolactate synthase large subunit [Christensenellaceae bacterium]|jgi:acetolactate synthase-1/2/3 large subunit|nr:biosynthetic-type acetolactate synthase large subunit [Christensenellaceae bacterium]